MANGIEVLGVGELSATLLRIAISTPQQVGRALYQEALLVQGDSMEHTPVDTGALRASHETERPVFSGADVSVTIKVGGPAAGYAVEVHEDLEAHHEVGEAKFLESALNRAVPDIAERVAARLDLGT